MLFIFPGDHEDDDEDEEDDRNLRRASYLRATKDEGRIASNSDPNASAADEEGEEGGEGERKQANKKWVFLFYCLC